MTFDAQHMNAEGVLLSASMHAMAMLPHLEGRKRRLLAELQKLEGKIKRFREIAKLAPVDAVIDGGTQKP
jgi:hypothetical protein